MKREVNIVEEELRLQNSSELIYGNKDTEKCFPFDKSKRFDYVVYHEGIGYTEDGQAFSKKSTRRFSFFSPTQWDNSIAPKGKKTWFERNGKSFTILHDPILQARLEGVKIKGYHADKTGLSLQEKLAKAQSASVIGNTSGTFEDVTALMPEDVSEEHVTTPKKAGRPRKEVENV